LDDRWDKTGAGAGLDVPGVGAFALEDVLAGVVPEVDAMDRWEGACLFGLTLFPGF